MVRLEDILEKVTSYTPSIDPDIVRKAYIFSARVHQGQVRLSGEPYLNHPLEVASILAEIKMDPTTIAIGLLHDTVEDTHTTLEAVKEVFGEEIATLVDGLTKISKITFDSKEAQQAENFRKMLLAMAKDIRIILVKLADRLHNMRTLDALPPDKRSKIAQETLDIYAPLANRLGIGWMKAELEDLSFLHLRPEVYREIQTNIAKGQKEREGYIQEVKAILEGRLGEHGLKGKVAGRPKHIYGIYKKMEGRGVDFEHIYDIVGFRVIVETIKECYETLGVVHSIWTPVPGRFKDYIAIPKPNMYQSLHTVVIGPRGEMIEVQIRTEEMHRVAEEGIAAHWRYKEGGPIAEKDGRMFAWLRQLVEWQKELKDAGEFMETLKIDLFPEEVYVFTPKGDVREFPVGATPVDFAYSIHTDVGHRCVAAKVNGRLVSLRYQLKNGDVVEIITSPHHHPSKDWLKFVKTSRARTKIRQWIKDEERTRSIALGKEICEKEFKRHGLDFYKMLKSGEMENLAKVGLNLAGVDNLLAGIGYGKLSIHQVLGKLLPEEKLSALEEKGVSAFKKVLQKLKKTPKEAITVKGIEDVMIKFARCCNPLPGDKIIGFITRGKGVAIHGMDCPNVLNADQDRKIEVEWDKRLKATRPARIEVICRDEKGVLADMSSTISSAEANISSANIRTTPDKKAICTFEVEVNDLEHLTSIIKNLRRIRKVIKVERVRA